MQDTLVPVLAFVLFFGMCTVALYGWRSLPANARFRTRFGPTGIDGTMSKKVGLLTWPGLGLFVLLGTLTTSVRWLGVVVLLWLLIMEIVSVNSAIARHEG
jgi:hypothetical protein